MTNFFQKNSVFCDTQYRFQSNLSTTHALLDVLTSTCDQINAGDYTGLILLDFKKAFDTVCHKILLRKLEHYGIRGQALKLLNSFLHTRHQYVSYQNMCSKTLTNRFGVPQGSNLDPLLFLIYINDLPSAVNSVPRLFADDTCLLIHSPNTATLAENINSELANVHEWTVANKITVNPEKSLALIILPKITTSIPDIQLHFNNNSVTLKDSVKYLGITIDARLNFDVHINTLTRKTSRSLGVMTKLKLILPRKTLRSLYYTMIHP